MALTIEILSLGEVVLDFGLGGTGYGTPERPGTSAYVGLPNTGW